MKRRLSTGISIKTKREPVLKYIEDSFSNDYIGQMFEYAGSAININHTPWKVSQIIADNLPEELWADKTLPDRRFLFPFSDSGFLEKAIIKKLLYNDVMIDAFPDYSERVYHIMHDMIYSIAKTHAVSLILRKHLYYIGSAKDRMSLFHGKLFSLGTDVLRSDIYKEEGNIKSPYIRTYNNNNTLDGARYEYNDDGVLIDNLSQDIVGSVDLMNYPMLDWINSGLEMSEYVAMLFKENILSPKEIQGLGDDEIMSKAKKKIDDGFFDIIIGNPPYQVEDGAGGGSASAVYHHFINAAKTLSPRYTSFIIPSKWFKTRGKGKGLMDFANDFWEDPTLKSIYTFSNGIDAFPSVDTGPVVSYVTDSNFNNKGEILFTEHGDNSNIIKLDDYIIKDTSNPKKLFIHDDITHKVISKTDKFLRESISVTEIFGLRPSDFKNGANGSPKYTFSLTKNSTYSVKTYIANTKLSGGVKPNIDKGQSMGYIYVRPEDYKPNVLSNQYRLISQAFCDYSYRTLDYPYKSMIIEPGEITTRQISIGTHISNKKHLENLQSYIRTKLVTYLITQMSPTQQLSLLNFSTVPDLDFSRTWTDEDLYKLYELTPTEIEKVEVLFSKFNHLTVDAEDEEDVEDEE